MKRVSSAAVILALSFLAVERYLDRVSAAEPDENAYFDSLARRTDLWKAWSLRDPAQLVSRQLGGLAQGGVDAQPGVTYAPAADTDRNRQDAAKMVIPAFFETGLLTQPVSASDTLLTLAEAYRPLFPKDRVIKVDREVMTVASWVSDTQVSVVRGTYSSAVAPHAAGAAVMHATNSLRTQLRLPLGTEDGHTYFFTWDTYWTDSFVGSGGFNHKAFQFGSGSQDGDAIFFEPKMAYGGDRRSCFDPSRHVGAFIVRSYNRVGGGADWSATDGNTLGPGVSVNSPISPAQDFCVEPNRWVRFFMSLRQRANDYDYVDLWAADEQREPVQVLTNIPISVRPTGQTPNSIKSFWVEFNTSEDEFYRLDNRDLVAYLRNFVALRDPGDVRSLLVRPVPGAAAARVPAPPRGLRILSSS